MEISLSGARPMVTGRLPMGASFKTAASNFSTNLATLVTS